MKNFVTPSNCKMHTHIFQQKCMSCMLEIQISLC